METSVILLNIAVFNHEAVLRILPRSYGTEPGIDYQRIGHGGTLTWWRFELAFGRAYGDDEHVERIAEPNAGD